MKMKVNASAAASCSILASALFSSSSSDALSSALSSAAALRYRSLATTTLSVSENTLANRHVLPLPSKVASSSSSSSSSSSLPLSALFSSSTQQDTSNLSLQTINHTSPQQYNHDRLPILQGDWSNAKSSLRNPNCCVVTISNIMEPHISVLQQYFCGEHAHSDLDLRMRVRGCRSLGDAGGDEQVLDLDASGVVYRDCEQIYNAVMMGGGVPHSMLSVNDVFPTNHNNQDGNEYYNAHNNNDRHRCIVALTELARGMASLTDGKRLTNMVTDVHVRVVCASNYAANDPMFHTDKCPLRGYVTLMGPGTEYMQETCLPWEYAALRSSGADGLNGISSNSKATRSLKMADELEFIVMKGDEYDDSSTEDESSSSSMFLPRIVLWNRSSACVHRSPPGSCGRRVILSLDLADGKDNQEWYEVGRRREWRSGMTQRKSRLVS